MTVLTTLVLQMNSQEDPTANAQWILDQCDAKTLQGVDWVMAPENALYCGRSTGLAAAMTDIDKKALPLLAKAWNERGKQTTLILGGVARPEANGKFRNSWLMLDEGVWREVYTKVNLFQAKVPGQRAYAETDQFIPGSTDQKLLSLSTAHATVPVGPSICFDLRFPEHYLRYTHLGAQVLAVPSAFTKLTGEAHWHALLRARAIENQCFVMAPAQVGTHPGDRQTYGHALVVDPWGRVLLDAEEKVGAFRVTMDLSLVLKTRQQIAMSWTT